MVFPGQIWRHDRFYLDSDAGTWRAKFLLVLAAQQMHSIQPDSRGRGCFLRALRSGAHRSAHSTRTVRSLSALAMTLTDDSAIAAAATTGDSSRPKKG